MQQDLLNKCILLQTFGIELFIMLSMVTSVNNDVMPSAIRAAVCSKGTTNPIHDMTTTTELVPYM